MKVCHASYSGLLRSDQTASRLPLAKGPVPKPKRDQTGNETHEIGIEYPAEVLHSDPLLRYHDPSDGPVDG